MEDKDCILNMNIYEALAADQSGGMPGLSKEEKKVVLKMRLVHAAEKFIGNTNEWNEIVGIMAAFQKLK